VWRAIKQAQDGEPLEVTREESDRSRPTVGAPME
jgi:hypothetical protein